MLTFDRPQLMFTLVRWRSSTTAAPAVCLAPVVYHMLITWLGERDTQDEWPPQSADWGPLRPGACPTAGAIATLADPLPCPQVGSGLRQV
jgi:hypothetical protein